MNPNDSAARNKGVVFVVDDDEDLLDVLQGVLEKDGYLVLGAREGQEALTRMRGFSGPATAVIDLMMPDMNGWQLVRAMKADPSLKHIPIITCSAFDVAPIDHTQKHLRKPIKPKALLEAVRASLAAQLPASS